MERVLITGGAGFIGLHLAKKLSLSGYDVCLIDNLTRGVNDAELETFLARNHTSFHNIDCLNYSLLDSISGSFSYIFHLAAIIGVAHVEKRPGKVITENIKLLENMLDFAEKQKYLRKFLFASTSEVYAGALENFSLPVPTPEGVPLAIADIRRPRTSYMLSKISGEALCHFRSVPVTIFRPHNIYGPRMGLSHVIPSQLLKSYQSPENCQIPVPSANQTRTFCYIDDAVEMLFRIMESENCVGKTLNLGNQIPEVTIEDLANLCFEVVGKNQSAVPRPPVLGSPPRRCPDMAHTFSLIGHVNPLSLSDGVRRTYDWYRENVFKDNGVTSR